MPFKKKMELKIERYFIARGNPTAIVENCPSAQRTRKAQELLKTGRPPIEQVGFLYPNGSIPRFVMMGEETSINGTLTAAFILGGEGVLKTSGIQEIVSYRTYNGTASINIKLPFEREDNFVKFEGIGYEVSQKVSVPTMSYLRNLCLKSNLPAFGLVMVNGDQIDPWVYVLGTDSLEQETACGSGSLATSIVNGTRLIRQPSGGTIEVLRRGDFDFTVIARVAKIGK